MKDIVFDNFYEDYDDWFNTKIGDFVDRIETDLLFKYLDPKSDMKILDLGCGTGNLTYKLANLGCNVTGIDISEKMLEEAMRKSVNGNGTVDFYKMNGDNIDFEDNSFDCVISNAAFEFIENPEEVLQELFRVLKPNGIVVIGTIQKHGEWANFYSSDFCKGTAYEKAIFKTGEELASINRGYFEDKEECLFISPNEKEENFNMENEIREKEKKEIGGFVCVKFKKKI